MADPQPSARVEEKKTSSLLNLLHIALDTYDDIFSDFDPSGYEHRILSDDFTKEIQKRYVETGRGDIEIRFSIPAVMRSSKTENLIKKRLKEYFQNQAGVLDSEIKNRKKSGSIYFVFGFVVILLTYYSADLFPTSHSAQVLATLITPLGWFGMWEGLGLIVQSPVKYEQQKKFYMRFCKANYVFINEEDYIRELNAADTYDATREVKVDKKA